MSKRTGGTSTDNDSLAEIAIEPLRFGSVNEVNWYWLLRKTEVHSPQVRNELLELVKYWYWAAMTDLFYLEVYWFSEYDPVAFAHRQISNIAEILGDAPVDEAIKEAEEEFQRRIDPELWEDFVKRSQERNPWRSYWEEAC